MTAVCDKRMIIIIVIAYCTWSLEQSDWLHYLCRDTAILLPFTPNISLSAVVTLHSVLIVLYFSHVVISVEMVFAGSYLLPVYLWSNGRCLSVQEKESPLTPRESKATMKKNKLVSMTPKKSKITEQVKKSVVTIVITSIWFLQSSWFIFVRSC